MLKNIIDLILATYDLSLSNNERRNKIEIINDYQENIFTLNDLKEFLNSNSKQEIKIFGFKCLESFILYKWNTADKIVAKTYLIEIIKEYGNFNLDVSAERAVRWIIAKTVVYFIRHECPQNCDTIIEDLINLKDNGVMTKALILSIFYCISESLPNDCQMPDKRKKEVIFFITDQTTKMICFCVDIIQENVRKVNIDVLNLSLEATKTIQSLASWVKFESIMSLINGLLPVVINSLIVDSSDYYLLEVLETILERKVKIEEKYKVLMVIVNNPHLWQKFVSNISTGLHFPINPYSDEKFRYLQKIFDLLLVIGNLVLNSWLLFSKEVNKNVINDLLNLFLIGTHHPIKILSVEFLSFWCNGFKNEQGLRNILVSNAQSLLPLLKSLSIKQNVRDSSNVDNEYLINLIEESESDAYVSRIRIEVSKTTGILTQYFVQDIITLAIDWVLSIVKGIEEMEGQRIDFLRNIQINSSLMKELEGSRFFIRCVMHTVFKPYSKSLRETVQNMLIASPMRTIEEANLIITKVLSSKDVNMHVSDIYLDYLCLLLPFIAGREEKIEQCLEKIFVWYGKSDLVDASSSDSATLKQLQMDCGVALLRVFRDYNFIIPSYLFERILIYHQSTCTPIYSRPNIIEALTLYICQSGSYTVHEQKILLGQFVDSIKTVICSDQLFHVFENGDSLIRYFQMERSKPTEEQNPHYPSLELNDFKINVSHAITALSGICRRLAIDQSETESGMDHAKQTETASIIAGSMTDAILPMLPSLFVILRSLNQIWSSKHVHSDFKSLTEISEHFRDSLVKNHSTANKFVNKEKSFGDTYVVNCRKFISKLNESVWTILAKCCFNFGVELYCLREWSLGVTDYVFADLGSLPNFKLMNLIKIFLIPFVTHCPLQHVKEVLVPTVVPFINYLFQIIGEHWKLIENNSSSDPCSNECDMDNYSEDHTDLTKEIIEEQVLRVLSKTFINLFKLTMTLGSTSMDDSNKSSDKLGIISDFLFSPNLNEEHPMIMMFLNHICISVTWRDSFCCSRLCHLIQPFVQEIHKRGLLTIDIIIFIMQQGIRALNIFAGNSNADIRLAIINLGLYIYDEHLSKQTDYMEKFLRLFDKSSSKEIHTFQHKMMPSTTSKVKREAFSSILQPYIGVPVNEMFNQEVCIKNLPPLLKAEWKSKNQHRVFLDGEEPLCLASLFD